MSHFPYEVEDRLRCEILRLDPDETVGAFKVRYAPSLGVSPEAITLVLSNAVRADEAPLSDDGFAANAPNDRCYIHLQIRDLELEVTLPLPSARRSGCAHPAVATGARAGGLRGGQEPHHPERQGVQRPTPHAHAHAPNPAAVAHLRLHR